MVFLSVTPIPVWLMSFSWYQEDLANSWRVALIVIPAKAGIQCL